MGEFGTVAHIGKIGSAVLSTTADRAPTHYRTLVDQQIALLRKQLDVDILSIVPNSLSGDNEERRIIEDIEPSPFAEYLPPFARSDHFDNPESPGPGIRKRVALSRAGREGVPLSQYDPDNDQIERLDQLAEIVQTGGLDG